MDEIERPEVEYAHTYASENADIYRAHDAGQDMMNKKWIKYHEQEMKKKDDFQLMEKKLADETERQLHELIAERDAEIARLKEENERLKKTVAAQNENISNSCACIDELRNENERLKKELEHRIKFDRIHND